MDFRILGPLEVLDDRGPVEITGGNTRAVLAELLLNADRPVSTGSLIETVWGGEPPESAPAMLRNSIAQLRRQVGDSIETTPAGYRLRLGSNTLDARRFAELVATGREAHRAGDAIQATDAFCSALDLWRGRALDGVGRNGEFELRTNALEQLRVSVTLDRIDAELDLGGNESAIASEVARLVEKNPYDERLRRQLMTALYRLGRQADALAAYQDVRRVLADDLGLEPDERLRDLERQILRHDPRLDTPRRERAAASRRRGPAIAVAVIVLALIGAAALIKATRSSHDHVYPAAAASVLSLDPVSGRQIATGLGGSPVAVAAGANGSWVATRRQAVIHVTVEGRIAETYGVGFEPIDLAVHGRTVWVVSRGYLRRVTRLHDGQISTSTLPEPSASAGRELHVAADAGGAWVGDGNHRIFRVDGVAARLVASAPDGLSGPRGGSLVTGAASAWVSDVSHDGVLTRLDGTTGGEIASISVPIDGETNGPATFGDGALWTLSTGEERLWRAGALENAITETIRVKPGIVGLAYGAGALWAVNAIDRTLVRIDTRQTRVTRTWRFSRPPVAVAASAGRVWVAFG